MQRKVQLIVKVAPEVRDALRRLAKEEERTLGATLGRILLAEVERRDVKEETSALL